MFPVDNKTLKAIKSVTLECTLYHFTECKQEQVEAIESRNQHSGIKAIDIFSPYWTPETNSRRLIPNIIVYSGSEVFFFIKINLVL